MPVIQRSNNENSFSMPFRVADVTGIVLEAVPGKESVFQRVGIGYVYLEKHVVEILNDAYRYFDRTAEQNGLEASRKTMPGNLFTVTIIRWKCVATCIPLRTAR
jgi:hypothetical protein